MIAICTKRYWDNLHPEERKKYSGYSTSYAEALAQGEEVEQISDLVTHTAKWSGPAQPQSAKKGTVSLFCAEEGAGKSKLSEGVEMSSTYVLKVAGRYITEGPLVFGVPMLVLDIGKARIFSKDEYTSFLRTVCVEAEVIEI